MTGVWWTVAGIVVVAAIVAAWRTQQQRTAAHDEWLRGVLLSDREVQELRQRFKQAAREHEEHGRD
jgi:hypothetical protein